MWRTSSPSCTIREEQLSVLAASISPFRSWLCCGVAWSSSPRPSSVCVCSAGTQCETDSWLHSVRVPLVFTERVTAKDTEECFYHITLHLLLFLLWSFRDVSFPRYQSAQRGNRSRFTCLLFYFPHSCWEHLACSRKKDKTAEQMWSSRELCYFLLTPHMRSIIFSITVMMKNHVKPLRRRKTTTVSFFMMTVRWKHAAARTEPRYIGGLLCQLSIKDSEILGEILKKKAAKTIKQYQYETKLHVICGFYISTYQRFTSSQWVDLGRDGY